MCIRDSRNILATFLYCLHGCSDDGNKYCSNVETNFVKLVSVFTDRFLLNLFIKLTSNMKYEMKNKLNQKEKGTKYNN